jgi:hypothetical protein
MTMFGQKRTLGDSSSQAMQTLTPSPRWPLYENRCREWSTALKHLSGEFRRDSIGDALIVFMVILLAAAGARVIYATSVGQDRFEHAALNWLILLLGAALLVLAGLGITRLGIRYRFSQGDISEVSARGRLRWHEPLATLQMVRFPWSGGRGPQMLTLHWSTHRRTIELFPSIVDAVDDLLRSSRPHPAPQQDLIWNCKHCREPNPASFDLCWQCGNDASARRQE